MNLPNYEFLSAPLWLVTTLHLLTLSLHFLAMNFLLGGVIVVVQAGLRGRGDDPTLVRFTRLFPPAMAATVTLGVAPLLFLQLVYHRQAYAAAIVSGWFWLMVVAAVLVAYAALYVCAGKSEKSVSVLRGAANCGDPVKGAWRVRCVRAKRRGAVPAVPLSERWLGGMGAALGACARRRRALASVGSTR